MGEVFIPIDIESLSQKSVFYLSVARKYNIYFHLLGKQKLSEIFKIKYIFYNVNIFFTYKQGGLYSSVAEHWSCKPGVESSILSGGIIL